MAAATADPLFTRGGPDMADTRGSSMVQKHLEKLQQAKEEAAMKLVRAAVPELGATVCALALEGAGWEADEAISLLREFEADRSSELAPLQQKRQELSKPAVAAAAVSPSSDSSSNSDSNSGSDSSSERGRRKKRSRRSGKHKMSSKSSKRKHKKGGGKHKKRRRGDSRDGKRDKRGKEDGIEGVVTDGFGAHGILRETDMFAKRYEFQAWATDVQKIDVEILPKQEERELFKTFMEDYNTSTLPHVKYYDLEAYEKKKAAKAAKRGAGSTANMERTAFDDEAERRAEQAEQRRQAEAERLRDAYNQLKYVQVGKAEDMREQEMLRLQMQNAYRVGDHETAQKLAARLAPDDPAKNNAPPDKPNF